MCIIFANDAEYIKGEFIDFQGNKYMHIIFIILCMVSKNGCMNILYIMRKIMKFDTI